MLREIKKELKELLLYNNSINFSLHNSVVFTFFKFESDKIYCYNKSNNSYTNLYSISKKEYKLKIRKIITKMDIEDIQKTIIDNIYLFDRIKNKHDIDF